MTKDKGFTIVQNEVINSGEISLKALGLFLYLKSKPKDWKFSTLRIKNELSDGITIINSAMQELERLNLLERRKIKNEKGQFEVSYIFLDEKTMFDFPSQEKPFTENHSTGKPEYGKTETGKSVNGKSKNNNNTYSTNTDKVITEVEILIDKEIKPSENGSLFEKDEVVTEESEPKKKEPEKKVIKPRKPKKEVDTEEGKLYGEMVTIYFDWFEKLSGVQPNFNAAEGSSLKKIINYFKALNKKHKREGEGSESEEVKNMFTYILTNWKRLSNFHQSCTKLTQINSNIQNIINEIKNGSKQKSGSNVRDKSADARKERLQDSFSRIDEMLFKGR